MYFDLDTLKTERLSMQQSIDWVRTQRNYEAKKYLNKPFAIAYFKDTFSKDISNVRFEFMVRDIRELLITPVDLAHYASLLKALNESSIEESYHKHGQLITEELSRIFKKYV